MARIIKKAITPVLLAYTRTARRNYSSSSSCIFIPQQLKNSSSTNISRSSSLIYQIRTPTRDFSSSIDKKGPSGSDKIISAGEEALLKKVVETPSGFPFKIEDKPGEQTYLSGLHQYISEKPLWIEVPSKGFYASESELEDDDEYWRGDYSNLFLDGEAFSANPYRGLPPKIFGDPPVISEEMDKILYPDLYVG
ncbi:hypothetical protein MKW98_004150 [Papaver atlanticum]|uniref:Uncharacterized protein n=1 Tax=Papaver atlanticum TaxID=357466 RepID=A0AAD4XNU5_9MAGN|nr:hypothetical protein MKW98_004150 [Papaver atlanticum]